MKGNTFMSRKLIGAVAGGIALLIYALTSH